MDVKEYVHVSTPEQSSRNIDNPTPNKYQNYGWDVVYGGVSLGCEEDGKFDGSKFKGNCLMIRWFKDKILWVGNIGD